MGSWSSRMTGRVRPPTTVVRGSMAMARRGECSTKRGRSEWTGAGGRSSRLVCSYRPGVEIRFAALSRRKARSFPYLNLGHCRLTSIQGHDPRRIMLSVRYRRKEIRLGWLCIGIWKQAWKVEEEWRGKPPGISVRAGQLTYILRTLCPFPKRHPVCCS
jgi:hypothetical protein